MIENQRGSGYTVSMLVWNYSFHEEDLDDVNLGNLSDFFFLKEKVYHTGGDI